MTFPVIKSRLVKWPWGLFNWIVADMVTALGSPIGSGHSTGATRRSRGGCDRRVGLGLSPSMYAVSRVEWDSYN